MRVMWLRNEIRDDGRRAIVIVTGMGMWWFGSWWLVAGG